jgi:two-component system, sensor histidine kinase RegB
MLIRDLLFMLTITRFIRAPHTADSAAIVRNLVYLRLLVLLAICAIMLLVHLYYEPLTAVAGMSIIVLAAGVWSVLVLVSERLTRLPLAAMREILMDFVWVFLLVLLSGRSTNPFIYYYLVLVAISASIFPARTAWAFCVGGIVVYTGLLLLDIGAHFEHMAERYRLHLAGMWLNYVGSSLVTCFFISRLAKLIREQQTQLAEAREENLKNEQLIGIGTVAASTVHSLATPLSTLTVLAEDMASSETIDPGLRDDLAIMLSQVNRCKRTMKDLANIAQGWQQDGTISVAELQFELEEYYTLNSPGNIPAFTASDETSKCRIASNLLLQHALINLINNAVESAQKTALVTFQKAQPVLNIVIENETNLTPADVFQRWGKPQSSEKNIGLGIGSFLANSTIEKLGGTVQLQAEQGGGESNHTQVTVTISLPLDNP